MDPFAGTGTTLEAALLENRSAIGIERCADYTRLIAARMGDATTFHTYTEGLDNESAKETS